MSRAGVGRGHWAAARSLGLTVPNPFHILLHCLRLAPGRSRCCSLQCPFSYVPSPRPLSYVSLLFSYASLFLALLLSYAPSLALAPSPMPLSLCPLSSLSLFSSPSTLFLCPLSCPPPLLCPPPLPMSSLSLSPYALSLSLSLFRPLSSLMPAPSILVRFSRGQRRRIPLRFLSLFR